jgi:hypothetical protein
MPVLAAAAVACVTAKLTPEAEAIRVTSNPEAVRGCTLLGEISGKSSSLAAGDEGATEEDARRRLRLAAVEKGADVVLVQSTQVAARSSVQRGEAYRCASADSATKQ